MRDNGHTIEVVCPCINHDTLMCIHIDSTMNTRLTIERRADEIIRNSQAFVYFYQRAYDSFVT